MKDVIVSVLLFFSLSTVVSASPAFLAGVFQHGTVFGLGVLSQADIDRSCANKQVKFIKEGTNYTNSETQCAIDARKNK